MTGECMGGHGAELPLATSLTALVTYFYYRGSDREVKVHMSKDAPLKGIGTDEICSGEKGLVKVLVT